MNEFNEIKDIEGNAHFVIKKNNYKEKENKENIGKNLDDFEFLQILGEGAFGEAYKVKSKLNNKIYALKKVNLKKFEKPRLRKYAERETKLLSLISHPRIINYYDNFPSEDKEYLYIIMENAENGDLNSLITGCKKRNEYISEEELWIIFLQCMQGLAYIHKIDVIHRDIKPENIFIDNNMNIKIGDFGFAGVKRNETDENKKYTNVIYVNEDEFDLSDLECTGTTVGTEGYMAKEVENKEYDQKIDVYSMGVTFYKLCFHRKPPEDEQYIKSDKYSKEMTDIIFEMKEPDKEKRQTSEYFLKKIEQAFSKKYNRITSINALMSCLHSFEDITDFYIYLKPSDYENKAITTGLVKSLIEFSKGDMKLIPDTIKNFREIICGQNSRFDKSQEIKPELILPFIIEQINNEADKKNNLILNVNNNNNDIQTNHLIKTGEEFDETNETEMKINFLNKCFTQLNSYLSKKTMGLIKIIYKCEKCKMETYSFCAYFFININLENIKNKNNPNIEDYINYNNNITNETKKYCPKCLSQTIHKKSEKYDAFPYYLIIMIQRGNNPDEIHLKLSKELDLNKLIGINGKKYNLVGFIDRDNKSGDYVSFIKFKYPKSKKWMKIEKEEIKRWKPNEHKDMFSDPKGELIMAFYEGDW